MCGRVVTTSSPEELSEYVGADAIVDVLEGPNYNVPPSDRLPLVWVDVAEGPTRMLGTARWGLVPRWAKDPTIGDRLFNARAETVAEKPSFRAAFRKQRCLIPVDGFYEWGQGPGGSPKQPWFVHRVDGAPLTMAGLWEGRLGDDGALLRTCTVITVPANADLAPVHHRMPALLPPSDWADWLDPTTADCCTVEALLASAPEGLLERHPVDRRVNDARRKGEDLIQAVHEGRYSGPHEDRKVLW